jgi:hypothetical protein
MVDPHYPRLSIERWSRFAGQIGGSGKVDRDVGYAASFSVMLLIE